MGVELIVPSCFAGSVPALLLESAVFLIYLHLFFILVHINFNRRALVTCQNVYSSSYHALMFAKDTHIQSVRSSEDIICSSEWFSLRVYDNELVRVSITFSSRSCGRKRHLQMSLSTGCLEAGGRATHNPEGPSL